MSCKIFDTTENCKTNEHNDCIRCVFGPNGRSPQSYVEWYQEWQSKIKLEKKYPPLTETNQIQCVYCGAIGSHICIDGRGR